MLKGSLTNVLMGIQNELLVTKNFCRFDSDYGAAKMILRSLLHLVLESDYEAANTIVSVVSCYC